MARYAISLGIIVCLSVLLTLAFKAWLPSRDMKVYQPASGYPVPKCIWYNSYAERAMRASQP